MAAVRSRLLLLLLLSCFSRVRLCVTPQTAAHQAPLSLGFSRQEHWSGLPFPPPMHQSEKWKWSRSVVSDSATPWTPRLLCPWDSPGKNTGVGYHFLLQGIFLTQGLNLYLLLVRQILYHWATWEAQRYESTCFQCSLPTLVIIYLLFFQYDGWKMII